MSLRFLTSGESHGRGLLVIVEGLPAGLPVQAEDIERELTRRRRGYGRGARMALERDEMQIWGGLRGGCTTGAPVGVSIANSEYEKWEGAMHPFSLDTDAAAAKAFHAPRPGHADLPGAIKYRQEEFRNILERASARTTAPRTVAGALAKTLLASLGVRVRSAVARMGGVAVPLPQTEAEWARAMDNHLGCATEAGESALVRSIDEAKAVGDSLGGVFVVSAVGVPAGLGSGVEWDRRLDTKLGGALLSIPAMKGVEIGDAFAGADLPGSLVHDELFTDKGRWARRSNHAGGIEGGMSNGEEIVLRVAMKPIPTMTKALHSVDVRTGEAVAAHAERSDVCAVAAACVVAEAMTAWVLAGEVLELCGGDHMEEVRTRFAAHRERAERWLI